MTQGHNVSHKGWVEVAVHAAVDSGELLGLLDDPTLSGGWEGDGVVYAYWPAEAWDPAILGHLRRVLTRLGVDGNRVLIEVAPLGLQDWNARWASQVEPVRIGRRLLIRPSWTPPGSTPGLIELILDPKQAFGTGHHATTQLLLECLEDRLEAQARVLDVGTGSGILAMAALRLGARFALGIDHDAIAIECARGYARDNGFGRELELRVQDLAHLDEGGFDWIVANLDRRTLVDQARCFQRVGRGSSRVLVSGILEEDQNAVIHALGREHWTLEERREREGWIALGFAWASGT